MRRFVFIYARSDSSRLPGKVMLPFGGQTIIDVIIERAQLVGAEGCALLTSSQPVDDGLAAHCSNQGICVVRGHPTDLIARTVQALDDTRATHFLRLNADSPFFAPELARYAMEYLSEAQMISNLVIRRFPYGVAVEWIRSSLFRDMANTAEDSEREHVTKHLYRQIDSLSAFSLTQRRDDSHMRLAVDTLDDYSRLKGLIRKRCIRQLPYWENFGLAEPKLSLSKL